MPLSTCPRFDVTISNYLCMYAYFCYGMMMMMMMMMMCVCVLFSDLFRITLPEPCKVKLG